MTAPRRYLAITLSDVLEGIRAQPARNALSLFAIAIGAAALAVLIAILGGLNEKAEQLVQELGGNVVVALAPKSSEDDGAPRLSERHLALLKQNLPGCTVSGMRIHRVAVPGHTDLLSVVATDSALPGIRQWQLRSGRMLDLYDISHHERNIVIGEGLAELWHVRVGDTLLLESTRFSVVGIIAIGGGAVEAEFGDPGMIAGERLAVIPHTASHYWASDTRSIEGGFDAIFIGVPAGQQANIVAARSQRLLASPETALPGITWVTPESLVRSIGKLQKLIALTVGSIAALCLILGGATLVSLMVANVRERVTEIGLRRALGATRRDIVVLFGCEAFVITAVAGTLGSMAIHVVLVPAARYFPTPLALGWLSALVPIVAAIGIGMIFASWPARNAARIMPAEALRND